ncbi:tyrosine--tRNA ligase [Paenibacillus sp. FSL R7-0048]|jgi:tyrosyl-tRNA synthetase|uniref:Tyrosine--tRNA ligase n=1 Tax=Paenibacillus odorifer TaxID=189426 RepID=A0ABX3GNI4_9BACL|nr:MULTISPECIES: tyrosine--tRNA ligase [Paenibacillus]MDH6428310.1 tyrosyl-tRNA synthetase [Paenibacillus sp. PastH-4]MDH6444058.1 tyrosyl-tRNA synthetase [Paenibacillus sp. PastF-4]MDH6527961.1 tyrosyl-tRNA synthetase [Paenibacillus sp. PastH-3]OMC69741.1 tyrosine--tRNA ligase [Paenibacillus odorifer]OMC78845.1 tyrosine--tRNA ligase [Paenibacillus odorifer]
MNIIDELEWRDAINQQTDAEGLRELTNQKSVSLYCGVDPTGDSMHIGHLIPFMVLKRFQLAGHRPVILIGGATGTIGDPSGRQSERSLQTLEQIQANVDALTAQMKKLFVTDGDNQIRMVNNYDWTHKINVIEFLRDYGKNFSINSMLAKDVVASRLDSGISFTEFSYQILQSLDYLHLFQHEDVQLQIGGSDQWGNITSGLDLIRKKEGSEAVAFGLTIPLMLKADGTKFGKTAGGAIWLDPNKTTAFEFYQFWANTDDRDVVKYLKYFTFLSKEQIDALAEKVQTEPHKREAQITLAEEMTRFVHGEELLEQAKRITAALFSGDIKSLTADEIEQGFKEMPTYETTLESKNIVEWLVDLGIEPSKRQAREDITKGAISMNGEKVSDVAFEVTASEAIGGRFIIIRKGKKNYSLVKLS